ncbi:MAG: tetratricopeptide repeat protein [Acidobacteria bacterium]|nr:tetratricopeptide repeat protein [Acidobacteriota bacterium]
MAAKGSTGAAHSPTPTVTLGELYLAQGHRREAAEIFERVLRADPANRRAREGLEGLRAKSRPAAARRS